MIQKTTTFLLFLLGLFSRTSCYFILIQEPKNWTEAQSFCKENYHDLATVQSDQDRSEIKEIGNMSFNAWVGLYDGVCDWRWSFRDQNVEFKYWWLFEQTTSRTQRKCGMITIDIAWHTASCEGKKPFFCYTGNDSGDKFVFIDIKLTWRDAQHHCRMNYIDLATISGYTDNSKMYWLIISYYGYYYFGFEGWIGLSKNLWQWSDQSTVSWSSVKWASGEPDNDQGDKKCAFVQETGLIGDEECSQRLPFFCTKRREMQRVRVAVKSAGYLNESAVMAAVEEKISQILSEQKMDAQSNVTWRVQPDGKIFQLENETRNTTTTCDKTFAVALLFNDNP